MNAEPSRDVIRRAIELQVCPWCQRGPFKVLSKHTWRVHQVSAAELRNLADYTHRRSLCSPDHAAEAKERLVARLAEDPEMCKRGGEAAKNVGALDEAHRVRSERWAREREPLQRRITVLYRELSVIQEVADELGISRSTVRSVLSSQGLAREPATDRYRNPLQRQRATQHIREIQVQRQEDQRKRASARIAEFRTLGGGSSAVAVVASRWGISRTGVRHFLRRHGVQVTNGHQN